MAIALVEVNGEELDAVVLPSKRAGDQPPVEGPVVRVARLGGGAEELGQAFGGVEKEVRAEFEGAHVADYVRCCFLNPELENSWDWWITH